MKRAVFKMRGFEFDCVFAIGRFIDEILEALNTSLVSTLKQFKKCSIEDVDWPLGTPGGKKVFLKMALEQAEEPGTNETDMFWTK